MKEFPTDGTEIIERRKRRDDLREAEMTASKEKTGYRKWFKTPLLSEQGECLMLHMTCQQVLDPPEP